MASALMSAASLRAKRFPARQGETSHDVQTSVGGSNFTLDDRATSFAMKLGGGLDLRLIEFDYNPIFARDRAVAGNAEFTLRLAGRRSDTYTFGFGVAFHCADCGMRI
jgi:hypothetical protein